ncbi:MAG: GAF domain-containing sensor histidine kinase [Magnetococcales bacterium]|nr:GAF domain-containing sensor histidine kinase [Magnetococcales bacterium]
MIQSSDPVPDTNRHPDATMTVQQVNVIINRLLQLSLEPLTLVEYLDEVIFVLTAAPWLPVSNRGAIFLWDEHGSQLRLSAQVNMAPEHQAMCRTVDRGHCLCGQAVQTRHMVLSDDFDSQHANRPPGLAHHGDCAIPLQTEDRLLGVLHLSPLPEYQFNDQELTFLRAISSTLSSAIIRFQQEEQLQRAKIKAEEDARILARQHEELLAADRLRVSVEHITRHDLKTPLAGIVSFADMLLEHPDLDEEIRNGLKIILDSGYRALHMVNLSLYLFQMEQGIYNLRAESIDAIPLIHKIFRDLTQSIERFQIIKVVLLDGRNVRKGDRFLFLGEELLAYSMFANLIKNAVEASQLGQCVTLSLTRAGTKRQIDIHNQTAVDPGIRDRFFEKFVTSGKKFGTGLGTYSAKLIAETMGGSITMTSSEETGTTVTLLFSAP